MKVWTLAPRYFSKRYLRLALLLAESLFEVCLARFKVAFVPFRVYKQGLGQHMHTSPQQQSQQANGVAKQIKWAIAKSVRYLPFHSSCMVQAMAAKAMLKKRALATTFYIGVANDQTRQGKLNHAWLRSGALIVTGYQKDLDSYAIIGTYAEKTTQGESA